MARLKPKEIAEHLENEGVKIEIPSDAHSVFIFNIKEEIPDLIKTMKRPKYHPQERDIDEEGKVSFPSPRANPINDWKVVYPEKDDKTHYLLSDPYFDSDADVTEKKDGSLEIITAWGGYQYTIRPNEEGGSSVEFQGPLNGLLRQNLLPKMTYVPHTLEAKFVSSDDSHDLTEFMPIEDYCALRKEKNRVKENTQDNWGVHINRAFNNEIPGLPYWENTQTYKNEQALEEHKWVLEHGAKRITEARKQLELNKLEELEKEKPIIRAGIRASTPTAKSKGTER